MCLSGQECPQLFVLKLGKFAELDFVYALVHVSTNSNQLAQNTTKQSKKYQSVIQYCIKHDNEMRANC